MISIVNIIPKSLSNETHQDSEPNLSINPAQPLQIAATAFTPNPSGGPNAPIYVSSNGGTTWTLNANVPGGNSFSGTGDITLRFSTSSNTLYAGDLRGDAGLTLNVLRTNNFAGAAAMTVLESRAGSGVDQPWTQAATNAGKDKLYVGNNDFNAPGGKTATIDESQDAAAAAPAFTSVRIEKRTTSGQNGPQIRMSVHPSGVIYATFYGWRSFVGGVVTADVVVVRDDAWGAGANPFTALVDSGDHLAGVRVATGSTFTWSAPLGQQRTGGDLSIAVDPTNAKTAYLAFADRQGAVYTLHLRRTTNSGATWSADILTIPNATNPAVAINNSGKVAFLYQQVTGTNPNLRWETHIRTSPNGAAWDDTVLANTPAGSPAPQFQPYLGDYVYLTANGAEFYGIFCANNTPDNANFPHGVTYQRNANFTTHTLLGVNGTTPVAVSIDPFFFKLTARQTDAIYHNWQTAPNRGWAGENALGGSAKQITAARNQDGRLEVFYVGTNDAIYHNWQTAPNSGWSGENALGGSAKQIAAAQNQDGRLEVFYVGTNNAIYHNWQTAPNRGWSGENALGGSAKQITAARNQDGRLEVFYVGTNNAIYHNWQTAPNSGWAGENALGGSAKQITVAQNQDGRLEVFYVGTNNAIYHNWQTAPNRGWSGENALGGSAKQITAARNQDGRLEVFYVGTNDAIYHNWQTAPNSGWSGENALGGSAKQITAAQNQDGRLEVFYVGTNDAIYHNWQTAPNRGWSGENALGGSAKQITAAQNQDGRLEIFYIA